MARSASRQSMDSDSSSSSSPERELDDDDYVSVMDHPNDSQSSLSVSLEEMELDTMEYELQRRRSPISCLPAELLIAVFSKLNHPSDLISCMLVSKTWARNSVDLLWHRPSTTKWKNLLNVIQTARKKDGFFAYSDLIKRINLATLKSEVSDGTLQPLSVCKRIERLTLPGCSQLTDMSLVPVIEGNRSLMAIDLSELDTITDRTMFSIAKNCYRLQGLNLSGCRSVTDESLVEVAKGCRRLKRLKLNECAQLTDYSVVAFADHCHEILEIDLQRCANITDMSVTALIKDGKQLRELRLAQCFRITDEAFLQLPAEQHFEALRILDLTDCNELQDAGLQKIVQAAPRLRNLVLAKCRNITDRGVLAVTKLGKNLHFLHLGHCSNITDHGVQALVKACNRIRYIDFSCCAHLTDDSISMLATLPKLKRIGLVKCANITDYSIRALAKPKACGSGMRDVHPNNLERLHLSYCTNLTISGIRTLLINCPQLTHLSLTGVQPFLIEDLLHFIRIPPDEFNEHQREVFCVFSGTGVAELRDWLTENYPTPPASDTGSDDDDGMPAHLPGLGVPPPGYNGHPLPYGYRQTPPLPRIQPGPPPHLWRPHFPQLPHLQHRQQTNYPMSASAPPQQMPLPPLTNTMATHPPHQILHTPLSLNRPGNPGPVGHGRPSPPVALHNAELSRVRDISPGRRPARELPLNSATQAVQSPGSQQTATQAVQSPGSQQTAPQGSVSRSSVAPPPPPPPPHSQNPGENRVGDAPRQQLGPRLSHRRDNILRGRARALSEGSFGRPSRIGEAGLRRM